MRLQDCGKKDPQTFASPSPSVYEANELANFVSVKRSKQKTKLIVGFSISSVSRICESLSNLQSLFTWQFSHFPQNPVGSAGSALNCQVQVAGWLLQHFFLFLSESHWSEFNLNVPASATASLASRSASELNSWIQIFKMMSISKRPKAFLVNLCSNSIKPPKFSKRHGSNQRHSSKCTEEDNVPECAGAELGE